MVVADDHTAGHGLMVRPQCLASSSDCLSLMCCLQHFGDDSHSDSLRDSHRSAGRLDTRKVVNVVITKSFNWSPGEVQTQALEVCFSI